MSSITSITDGQQAQLEELREKFDTKTRYAGYSAAAASFLLIGALIVITCGCLCLALPGVNVVTHVITRAVIPGIFGILISIPLILLTVKHNLEKTRHRSLMIDTMISHLEEYQVPEKKRKQRADFLLHNFLNWEKDSDKDSDDDKLIKNKKWTTQYQTQILDDIEERIGKEKKERNPRQEKIALAIKAAKEKIAAR